MLDKIKAHWWKILVAGIVLFVLAGTLMTEMETLQIISVLVAVALFLAGALGFALNILSAVGKGARRIGKGVKKLSEKMSGKIKGNSATSGAINRGIGDGVKFDGTSRLTLYGQNGKEVVFKEYGAVVYAGKFYAILQPVNLPAGMKSNEVLVFRVTRDSSGDDHYNIETSDYTVDKVLEKYNKL